MAIPVEQLIIKIIGDAKQFKSTIGDIQKANRTGEESFKKFATTAGVGLSTVGAAAAALAAKSVDSFKDFETGLTGVTKTTNLAGDDLDRFKRNIINLSEEIPVTTDRLLEIATSAGQLGITGVEDLTKFTKTIALLGATTDVEGEEAALTLARLLNITGENVNTVDRLGASLVDLGNNFAARESEILEISKDVAKATVQFGLGSDAILGMSAAMASLGIQAEAGGTVVGTAFQQIDTVIRKGVGPQFEQLIELTGMTGAQLKKTFETDASAVFSAFISGLGKAGKEGKSMATELNELGLSGIRIEKILPTLATRSDLLSDALKRAGTAAKENSALNAEAARAFETSASKLQIAQNRVNNLFVTLGAEVAPTFVTSLESIVTAVEKNKGALNALIQSFAFVVEQSLAFVGSIEKSAFAIRGIWDSAARWIMQSRVETELQNEFFAEQLKKRGITEGEFAEHVKKLREKSAEHQKELQKKTNEETTDEAINDKETKLDIETATADELAKIKDENGKRLARLHEAQLQILQLEDEKASEAVIQRKREEIDLLLKIDDLERKKENLLKQKHLSEQQREELEQTRKLLEIYNNRYDRLEEETRHFYGDVTEQQDAWETESKESYVEYADDVTKYFEENPIKIQARTELDESATRNAGGQTTGAGGGQTQTGGEERYESEISDLFSYYRGSLSCNTGWTKKKIGGVWRCVENCREGYVRQGTATCVKGYQSGGIVGDAEALYAQAGMIVPNKPGTKRDRVPIMAEPGEGILSKSTTALLLDTLDMFSGIKKSGMNVQKIDSTKPEKTVSIMQRVAVDLNMNENAAEFINARLREGQNLGTIIPV